MAKATKTTQKAVKANFHDQLILSKWSWAKFNPNYLQAMRDSLDHPQFEGIETEGQEAGQTKFFVELTRDLVGKHHIDTDTLRRYDLNIVKHWESISLKRNEIEGQVLNLKYFQYLSLLFTELYLDQYFNHQQTMLDELNHAVAEFNQAQKAMSEQFQPYEADDLNKIAFWNATGSGKTLLMHVNILQFLDYYQASHGGNSYPEQIILLTPNEGLSQQHLKEFRDSGLHATFFDKQKSFSGLYRNEIQIIDINKLAEKDGDKTVAVETLEGKNLVLIDEGHRGTSSAGVWMERRDVLTRNGFSFEYSATFGQAVSKAENVYKRFEDVKKQKAKMLFNGTTFSKLSDAQLEQVQLDDLEKQKFRREALREVYAKSILFDYSYRYFYADGYGKEVSILNMKDYQAEDERNLYLTACLLGFYQQQYLFEKNKTKLAQFNIEKPLWVFVGNKVNDDDSDILAIVKFLSEFLDPQNKAKIMGWLTDLIRNTSRLVDANGHNIFTNRFIALHGQEPEQLYQEILKHFFNTTANLRLNVIRITANKGELRLQVGENTPFAVINVGDEKGLYDMCLENEKTHYLNARTDDFSPSLFPTLNDDDSQTHLLVGSRKFTEGWSSWRVSTMGLLNMGTGEGAQIIQLFGRGVRLKGENFSLKRTPREICQKAEHKGLHLDLMQTLNIFGLRANYMEQFKAYLEDEGIILNQDLVTLDFPTNKIHATRLKTLVLKDGYKDNQANGFKAQRKLSMFEIPKEFEGKIKQPHVVLDLYPRLQALHTDKSKLNTAESVDKRQTHDISRDIMCLFDFDDIYLQLQQYKFQRGYHNLRLYIEGLREFCGRDMSLKQNDWYTLKVDASELSNDMKGIQKQQGILIELLKAYMDKFYNALKNAYEGQFYEVKEFDLNDDVLPIDICKQYTLTAKPDRNEDAELAFERLVELKELVAKGDVEKLAPWKQDGSFRAITFDRHLFYPLFDKTDESLPFTWSPMLFDYTKGTQSSEVKFVMDLQAYINQAKHVEELKNYSLYLLRNADSKYKGLGFALAGNFYPDFLLWLVHKETGMQYLTLVDPKGLRNMDHDHAKIKLHQEIKSIEAKVGDPNLVLNSFILSITPMKDIINNSLTQEEYAERNVLFMVGDDRTYLDQLFAKILEQQMKFAA
ncbi:type III restriction endonuclease subunit R [Acinetobacter sp. WCHAc010034]|uniref:DEAD/DEAH box helicase family protein n=1 Tax=Acinetobacter sp. WCHAc010034 TaxID=1879049 RepID=UPI00083A43EE|nr:DEAD/DEAH box helicase family protein [Acinetobacter sp. WCHAc010034]AYA04285.1 type III restriction endonuclease subunit R [Acinetobacter sp. WCHAc010034]